MRRIGLRSLDLKKNCGGDVKPGRQFFRQRLADRAAAGEDVADGSLRGDVGKVGLLEAVLRHQVTQHLARRSIRRGCLPLFVGLDHFTERFDQTCQRVSLVRTAGVEQAAQMLDGRCVLRSFRNGPERNQLAQCLVALGDLVEVDCPHHGLQSSYSACVNTART
ncbi:MAG: hypothetical protein WD929_03900 [Steroidobacteraceae bacterium]